MRSRQALLSFVGVYVTLLALIRFSDAAEEAQEGLSLVLGPFGAVRWESCCTSIQGQPRLVTSRF